MKPKSEVIARVVRLESDDWKALGIHAKNTASPGGRSEIIRKLVRVFTRKTGALALLKAQDRKRRKAATKAASTRIANGKRKPKPRPKPYKAKGRAA